MKFPKYNPGEYPHVLQIMQELNDPSSVNRALPLQPFATVFAKIEHVRASGTTRVMGQEASEFFAKISIPYLPGIASNMQAISENGNTYLIQDVTNEAGMNIVLHLNCSMIGPNTQ